MRLMKVVGDKILINGPCQEELGNGCAEETHISEVKEKGKRVTLESGGFNGGRSQERIPIALFSENVGSSGVD